MEPREDRVAARYWLIKSEPDVFGIDDLAKVKREPWSGVRNYQARNYMRDEMKPGDLAIFYHSNATPPGSVGVAKVAGAPYPDPTQFDPGSDYYDPASRADNPRWSCVEVTLERKLQRVITLTELKANARRLQGMVLLRPGSRLSVSPVEETHWNYIVSLDRKPA